MTLTPAELKLIAGGGEQQAAEPLPAPEGLSPEALKVWNEITTQFDFNAAELKLLVEAVEILDTITELKETMQDQPLLTKGYAGQQVINPIMEHVDKLQKTYSAHLKALGLTGTENVTVTVDNRTLSEKRRDAGKAGAAKRWATSR